MTDARFEVDHFIYPNLPSLFYRSDVAEQRRSIVPSVQGLPTLALVQSGYRQTRQQGFTASFGQDGPLREAAYQHLHGLWVSQKTFWIRHTGAMDRHMATLTPIDKAGRVWATPTKPILPHNFDQTRNPNSWSFSIYVDGQVYNDAFTVDSSQGIITFPDNAPVTRTSRVSMRYTWRALVRIVAFDLSSQDQYEYRYGEVTFQEVYVDQEPPYGTPKALVQCKAQPEVHLPIEGLGVICQPRIRNTWKAHIPITIGIICNPRVRISKAEPDLPTFDLDLGVGFSNPRVTTKLQAPPLSMGIDLGLSYDTPSRSGAYTINLYQGSQLIYTLNEVTLPTGSATLDLERQLPDSVVRQISDWDALELEIVSLVPTVYNVDYVGLVAERWAKQLPLQMELTLGMRMGNPRIRPATVVTSPPIQVGLGLGMQVNTPRITNTKVAEPLDK